MYYLVYLQIEDRDCEPCGRSMRVTYTRMTVDSEFDNVFVLRFNFHEECDPYDQMVRLDFVSWLNGFHVITNMRGK